MHKPAVAAFAALLLSGSATFAETANQRQTPLAETNPAARARTIRDAPPAKRAQAEADIENAGASLNGLEGLAALDSQLAELGRSLAALDGLEDRIADLERMAATETPVSTERTPQGLVRVYRNGVTVTDSGGSRKFQLND